MAGWLVKGMDENEQDEEDTDLVFMVVCAVIVQNADVHSSLVDRKNMRCVLLRLRSRTRLTTTMHSASARCPTQNHTSSSSRSRSTRQTRWTTLSTRYGRLSQVIVFVTSIPFSFSFSIFTQLCTDETDLVFSATVDRRGYRALPWRADYSSWAEKGPAR